jgi:hypothetical protein
MSGSAHHRDAGDLLALEFIWCWGNPERELPPNEYYSNSPSKALRAAMGLSLQSTNCVEHSQDCWNKKAASKRSPAARGTNTNDPTVGAGVNVELPPDEAAHQMNVLDHLIGVQGQIIKCRRLADETPDRATARRFYRLADDLERRVREVDRALCSPE